MPEIFGLEVGVRDPRLFFFLVILCSFCFVIRLSSIEEQTIVPQVRSKYWGEGAFAPLNRGRSLYVSSNGSTSVDYFNGSLRLAGTVVDEDVPKPELEELNKTELIKEVHRYHHDDQYLMYKYRCPTSVRYRIANNSHFKHKYIEDMPIFMWDKHLTPSEYTRLFRFFHVSGFNNMEYKNIASALRRLTTENNMYMFDDLLHPKEGPRKECIRCAIIGNGGILNGSRMGAEIDAHDYVFRVNTALTKGFEEDVGSKTSFYCFTMTTLANTLARGNQSGFEAPPSPPGIRFLVFADCEWTYTFLGSHFSGGSTGKYKKSLPKFDIPVTPDIVKMVHPDFERYLIWSWVNSTQQYWRIHRPTTGAIMLLVALHTCDEVDAYGFGGSHDKYSDYYYDRKFSRHPSLRNHDDRTEQKLWHLLKEQGIIKLYTRDDDR